MGRELRSSTPTETPHSPATCLDSTVSQTYHQPASTSTTQMACQNRAIPTGLWRQRLTLNGPTPSPLQQPSTLSSVLTIASNTSTTRSSTSSTIYLKKQRSP